MQRRYNAVHGGQRCRKEKMRKWIIACVVIASIGAAGVFFARPITRWWMILQSTRQHPEELAYAQRFLSTVIAQDFPPADWLDSVALDSGKAEYFYFLKVALTESRTTASQMRRARLLMYCNNTTNASFVLYYQRHCPSLEFTLSTDATEKRRVMAIFPLNNCLFQPDYNHDGKINLKDVELARQRPD